MESAQISVTVPRGLAMDIRQCARMNDRTVAAEVRCALRLYRHVHYLPRLARMAADQELDSENEQEAGPDA